MIGKLNHVAIVVPDLALAAQTYTNMLGATVSAVTQNEEQGVRMVYVELPNTKIELLQPIDESSPVNNFLDKSPSGGIHHVCYEVTDIIAARDSLVASAHAFWAMVNLKPAFTDIPFCFCIPRTSTAH